MGYTDPEAIQSEKNSMYLNSVIIEFDRPLGEVESLIRGTLARIDPNLTVFYFAAYDAQVARNFNQDRLIARLTSLFGILALVLASVGLYGVVSFFVSLRTSEIGIRMAMGASRAGIISLILRGALWPVLIGAALGLPAALYVGHLSASLLYGMRESNALSYLGAITALILSAAVAGLIPARRAASIDPVDALRDQ